jgi:RNA-directed DNA polymerase
VEGGDKLHEAGGKEKPGRNAPACRQAGVKGWSPEIIQNIEADMFNSSGRQHNPNRKGEEGIALSGSETTAWHQTNLMGTRETCPAPRDGEEANNPERKGRLDGKTGVGPTRSRGVNEATLVEPEKERALEGVGRYPQDNRETPAMPRSGERVETKLASIAGKAQTDRKFRFTALAHLLNVEYLTECFWELKRGKATGEDGVTVEEYGKNLVRNLEELVARMKAKHYRPQPVRRVYIPKDEKSQRPIGIPAVEDKIVQIGMTKILEAVFEGDFLEASYGFRRGRGCHMALKALDKSITRQPVNYVVEVDIKGFFDHVEHQWMMQCLEQRIADPSFLRLAGRFLKAGIMEEGKYRETEQGTPQGGNVSPMLSNIYLHYVLDVWFEKVLKKKLTGYAEENRYADDFVISVEKKEDAEHIVAALRERLGKFGLSMAEEKTRIVAFGRKAQEDATRSGKKPETFDYLGFTHFCGRTRYGTFKVGRKTSRKKFRAKLKAMNTWLRAVRNARKIADWWKVFVAKLAGHYRYYGVSGNSKSISEYHWKARELVYKWVNRRSQRKSYSAQEFLEYVERHPLPRPRIYQNFYALAPDSGG